MKVPVDRVEQAFAQAEGYDRQALVQRDVASQLARRLASLDLPRSPRVLEVGCGTGFLTAAARAAGIGGTWLVTDIAPAMLERCAARIGPDPAYRFARLDGERETPDSGPCDLICSSLALQWFNDASAALARMSGWLAPGGHLMVTTLGPDSFAEWRAAHTAEGVAPGTPSFAPVEAFRALPGATVTVEPVIERHADARSFLHAVKAIGAGTAHAGHRPLTPAELRRVMARFDDQGCAVTYEVVTIHIEAAR